mgnify:CR=1 FL=1
MSILERVLGVATALVIIGSGLPQFTLRAETYQGTNIESRVLIGLSAESEEVQALFPDSWVSIPFPQGPLAGAELLVALIDTQLSSDAQ